MELYFRTVQIQVLVRIPVVIIPSHKAEAALIHSRLQA